jgi:3-deoxy-manno-octulosonate cytidylyltransferase (CMP-KDO synthetase)
MSTAVLFPRLRTTSLVVIPARMSSSRLPRKMLLSATGKPLIQHTYESALRARRPTGVVVATDHAEIDEVVRGFGGQSRMTRADHPSGTDRVAEVAREMPDVDVFVNVQGDEPEIAGESIDLAIRLLEINPHADVSTLATPIRSRAQLNDPACVKVVFDSRGRAMYFSRSPIPHAREWDDRLLGSHPPTFYQHVGLYAYRRDFLLELAQMPVSSLERVEKLEQLRVLEAGRTVLVASVNDRTFGVDTAEDYEAFVARSVKGRGKAEG